MTVETAPRPAPEQVDEFPLDDFDELDSSGMPIDPEELAPDQPEDEESEATPEANQETEDRFTDVELLGRSFKVRAEIRHGAQNRVRKLWEGAKAGALNLRDSPGHVLKKSLHAMAKGRHEAKTARLQKAIDSGSSARLIARRQKVANVAEARMNARRQKADKSSETMKKRRNDVSTNYERRQNSAADRYKGKKESALARKALRRQLRSEGAGYIERTKIVSEIVSEISPTELRRIGSVAAKARAGERRVKVSEKSEAKTGKQGSRAEVDAARASKKAETYRDEAGRAGEALKDINEQHEEIGYKVKRLRSDLGRMTPEDPSYQDIQLDLQEAEEKERVCQREISYWKSVEASATEDAVRMEARAVSSLEDRDSYALDLEASKKRSERLSAASSEHRAKSTAAVNEVLNSSPSN